MKVLFLRQDFPSLDSNAPFHYEGDCCVSIHLFSNNGKMELSIYPLRLWG